MSCLLFIILYVYQMCGVSLVSLNLTLDVNKKNYYKYICVCKFLLCSQAAEKKCVTYLDIRR
ncbi:hypothetical protein DNTS_030949 [Danionella cerebrum]|uniref:Uncharacterized protein n=1 Tax=Danionella cerebrum TaxID=2873325 RepID=A0A553MXM8_9TELE|nr:hypothetical protein DNTS_030949 [Danionella translucida]